MVKVFVDELDDFTILEYLLFTHGIEHEVVLADDKYGLKAPYMLVYGVPLDEQRSINWILEQAKEGYFE